MPSNIENEDAYENAISRRIKANSQKTNAGIWIKLNDHEKIVAFLYDNHRNTFFGKLLTHYEDYAKLSEGQCDCVRRAIDKSAAQIAENAANNPSKHIGTIGERKVFELTVKFISSYDTEYGKTFVYVCEDASANVVVYKGSEQQGASIGDTLKGKATIKAHDARKGINQTTVNRPKFEVIKALALVTIAE